jgi:hypothetical protein
VSALRNRLASSLNNSNLKNPPASMFIIRLSKVRLFRQVLQQIHRAYSNTFLFLQ